MHRLLLTAALTLLLLASQAQATTPLSLPQLSAPGSAVSQDAAQEQWRAYERELKAWCSTYMPDAPEACVYDALYQRGLPPTVFDAAQTSPPRLQTLASWERCRQARIAALERQTEREGHPASYYFGAGGGGARAEVEVACGLKPSQKTLTTGERNALQSCESEYLLGDLSRQPTVTSALFWPYGEGSPHWKLAATECQRVYAAAQAHRQGSARPHALYDAWIRSCAKRGALAERVVQARNRGVPLTAVLDAGAAVTDLAQRREMDDFHVEIYHKTYWTPTEARQVSESRCMAVAPRK